MMSDHSSLLQDKSEVLEADDPVEFAPKTAFYRDNNALLYTSRIDLEYRFSRLVLRSRNRVVVPVASFQVLFE